MPAIPWSPWDEPYYDSDRAAALDQQRVFPYDIREDVNHQREPMPLPVDSDQGRAMTAAARKDLMISEGRCPLPGCGGALDEDWFCSMCGLVSTPKQAA